MTKAAVSDKDTLVILATSDFHGAIERAEALAATVRELRTKYGDRVIHLDGGDLFQGGLEGNLSKGRAMVQLYNAIGVDAMAMGNHELDYGPDVPGRSSVQRGEDGLGNLKARAREARFKILSANFVRKNSSCKSGEQSGRCRGAHFNALGQETVFPPHAIFKKGDAKVCVIGGTTETTPHITHPDFIKGTEFTPLKAAVEAEARYLREKQNCDYVLLTAHVGLLCKEQITSEPSAYCLEEGAMAEAKHLLEALPSGTIDAMVAGHTHLPAREWVKDMPVIQAGTAGKLVGVIILKGPRGRRIEDVKLEQYVWVPEKPAENSTTDVSDVTALMKPFRDAAERQRARPVGMSTSAWKYTRAKENALGNFIVDALRAKGKKALSAQFGIVNAGGVRNDLPAGQLNYGDIFKVLPFDNSLTVVELKGSELKRLVEIGVSGGHGLSPLSGLRARRLDVAPGERGAWDRDLNNDKKTEDWERNLLVELTDEQGRKLKDERLYRVATLDFLTAGGDHTSVVYDHVPKSRQHVMAGIWVRDVVVDYLKTHKTISPETYFNEQRRRVVLVPKPL